MKKLLIITALLSFRISGTSSMDGMKEYKYNIRPLDKYTTRSYPSDSIRRDTTRRYVYEFWVGEDGINYGTKNRRR